MSIPAAVDLVSRLALARRSRWMLVGAAAARLLQAQHHGRRAQVQPDAGAKACPGRLQVRHPRLTCWQDPDGGVESRPLGRRSTCRGRCATAATARRSACFDGRARLHVRDAGMCDPVCQTGCAAVADKCSVNTVGGADVQPAARDVGSRGRWCRTCTIRSERDGRRRRTTAGRGWSASGSSRVPRVLPVLQERRRLPESACTRDIGAGRVGRRSAMFRSCDTCVPLPVRSTRVAAGRRRDGLLPLVHAARRTRSATARSAHVPSNGSARARATAFMGLACVDRGTGATRDLPAGLPAAETACDCPGGTPAGLPPVLRIPRGARCRTRRSGFASRRMATWRHRALAAWAIAGRGRCRRRAAAASSPNDPGRRPSALRRRRRSARRGSTAPPTARARKGPEMAASRRRRTSSRSARPIRARTAIRSARAAATAGVAR